MKRKSLWMRAVSLLVALLLSLPLEAMAQQEGGAPQQMLSREELAQLLAPIALYPDELVSQILIASTYPLEIVQADRWAQQNKNLKGDALTKELEKQSWDPSVKSLVNFPSVLSAMSQKLDLTSKVGDAFLAQQKDVMDTIQQLRRRAYDAGNLKTSKEQKVVVEKETIVIQPASPQVVYVPTYSTTVVYGTWPYPAYPPAYYYPPPPAYYPAFTFAAGVALGAAWGYAWSNCNWGGGSVNYNVNRNTNINNSINRSNYARQQPAGGGGNWQHNPEHRKGVAYRDNATAKKFGQSPGQSMQGRGNASRGYGDGRGGGAGARPSAGTMDRGGRGGAGGGPSAGTMDKSGRGGAGKGPTAGTMDKSGRGGAGGGPSAGTMDRSGRGGAGSGGGRDSAFSGGSGSGKQERAASNRGQSSRQSSGGNKGFSGGGSSRSGGGFGGGGGRSGGGFGGGGGRGGGGGGRR
ncbi:MAG TPA: DUF3300 domain-containing protein [Geobacteraceae bacterium]|nr:DUF3300 domain-containing protein [Geobacteraceae bacterium]